MGEKGNESMGFTDISDLPPELIKQLSLNTPAAKMDALVLRLVPQNPTIDQLLITLWRRNKIIYKRSYIRAALSRLKADGKIVRVGSAEKDSRVGVYRQTDCCDEPQTKTPASPAK